MATGMWTYAEHQAYIARAQMRARLADAENAIVRDEAFERIERARSQREDEEAAREIQELRRWAAQHAPRKAAPVARRDGGRVVLREERSTYAGRPCVWTTTREGGREVTRLRFLDSGSDASNRNGSTTAHTAGRYECRAFDENGRLLHGGGA